MEGNRFGNFEAVILCEDVRREDNGKIMILGTYVGDVMPQQLPATLALRLYVHYMAPTLGKHKLDFEWLIDGERAALMEGTVTQENFTGPISLALPLVALPFQRESVLSIVALGEGEERRELIKRTIRALDTGDGAPS